MSERYKTHPDRAEEFFANPELTALEADRAVVDWMDLHRLTSKKKDGAPAVLTGKLESAIRHHKKWADFHNVTPLSTVRQIRAEQKTAKMDDNLPRWEKLFSEDGFDEEIEKRGMKDGYDQLLKMGVDQEQARNQFRRMLFTKDLTGSRDDAAQALVGKSLLSSSDFSDEAYLSDAKSWVSGKLEKKRRIEAAYSAGIDAYFNEDSFSEGLESQRELGEEEAKTYLLANQAMRKEFGPIVPLAKSLVESVKAEGARGLFEEKESVDVNYKAILNLYKAGRSKEFLYVLGKIAEKESVSIDGFLTRNSKWNSRMVENILRSGERFIDTIRTNFEEGSVSKEQTETDRAWNQFRADIANLKDRVAQINPANDFEKVINYGTGTVPYMMLAATGAGMGIIATTKGQEVAEGIIRDNPELDYGEAMAVGLPAGIVYAGIEKIQLSGLLGKLPVVQGAIDKIAKGGLLSRIGAVAGVEYTQETFQDAVEPAFRDIANLIKEEIPEGDWEHFDVLSYDRFLGILGLSIIGGGGQYIQDRVSLEEQKKILQDKEGLLLSGATEQEANSIIELADKDPALAREKFKNEILSKPKEERQKLGDEAAEIIFNGESSELADLLPMVTTDQEGGIIVKYPEGTQESVGSLEEAQELVTKRFKEEFVSDAEAVQAYLTHLKDAAEGDNKVTQGRKRSFQELADMGIETEANLKKAVAVYLAQTGQEVPANIDLRNYFEQGSVTLRRKMAGFAVRLAKDDKTNPLTVAEEFSEGFLRMIVGRGETTFEDVKKLLDEFGELAGIEMTQGYDIDPERAVIEGFSKFAKAYMLQGQYDALPSEVNAWSRKAWRVMENPDAVPSLLRATAEFFTKLLKSVFDVAKAIQFHKIDGNGINADLESLAQRALGLDEKAIMERMREKAQQEILEDLFDPSQELSAQVKGRLPHPDDLIDDPLHGEVKEIWSSMSKETRRRRKDGRRVVSDAKARNFFAKKGEGESLDDLRRSLNEEGFNFVTPAEMVGAIQDSIDGEKMWPIGFSDEIGQTFSIGRATVTTTPDTQTFPTKDGGLIGPATFSISAYHGTPHKVDKFSTEKIGTGEGAQAYGWGLYFAESEEVAEGYRDTLSKGLRQWSGTIDGRKPIDQREAEIAWNLVSKFDGNADAYLADLKERNDRFLEGQKEVWIRLGKPERAERQAREISLDFKEQEEIARRLERSNIDLAKGGRVYTVNLKVEQEEFLDWDKPLSEQSDIVRKALAKFNEDFRETSDEYDANELGQQTYQRMVWMAGLDAGQRAASIASADLSQIGIKGIRYLDGNSRGKGEGSYNYVIFNDNDIEILEENGQPVRPQMTFSIAPDPKPYKDRSGDEQGEPLTRTEIREGIEDEPGTVVDPGVEIDTEKLAEDLERLSGGQASFSISPKVSSEAIRMINAEDLKGKKFFSFFADRMRVGTYTGIDPKSGISVPLQGGMDYPAIEENYKAGAGWAVSGQSMFNTLVKAANETDGIALVAAFGKGNVTGNRTFNRAYFEELRHNIRTKRISKTKALAILNEVRMMTPVQRASGKAKDSWGKQFLENWKTVEEAEKALHDATFDVRGQMFFQTQWKETKEKGRHFSGSKIGSIGRVAEGMPDIVKMVNLMEDPRYDKYIYGELLGAVEIEKGQEGEAPTAKDLGTVDHFSYEKVVKGRPFGHFPAGLHLEEYVTPDKTSGRVLPGQAIAARVSFSITPAQDAEYLELAKKPEKNRAALQKMVDGAAKKAGYDETGWHGTNQPEFEEFKPSAFFGKAWFFSRTKDYPAERGSRVMKVFLDTGKTKKIKLPADSKWSAPAHELPIIQKAKSEGFDSIHLEAVPPAWMRYLLPIVGLKAEVSGFTETTVVFNPNQIKSADPVTYDENGNVIPLSERFNEQDNRITYAISEAGSSADMAISKLFGREKEIREKLEKGLSRLVESWDSQAKANAEEMEESSRPIVAKLDAYYRFLPKELFGDIVADAEKLTEDILSDVLLARDGVRIRDRETEFYSGIPFKLPEWMSRFSITQWVARHLRARGNLTREQFQIKLASEAVKLSELKKAELINRRLKKAVREEAKKMGKGQALGEELLMRRVQAALVADGSAVSNAISSLPKSLQEVTTDIRSHVDYLSRKMIALGIAKGNLAEVFQRNLGSYLNRSYRRFTRPKKWKYEVSQEAKDNAKKWLYNNLPSEAFSANIPVDEQLDGWVESLLSDSVKGNFTDNLNWLLGQKYLGNLIKRENVPIELRELFGEYKRADENYLTTVRKMAAQIGSHTMLVGFRKDGMGTLIFDTPRKGFAEQITASPDETLAPLDGLYVSEEMAEALKDFAEGAKKVDGWLKWWLKFNSTAKVTKTVYNPTTHARNFFSNFLYTGANGNLLAYVKFGKDSATLNLKEIITRWDLSKDQEDMIQHYVRLGIMQQGAVSQEFRDILNDFSAGDIDIEEYSQNKIKKGIRATTDTIQAMYQAEDDFHKIVAFEAERQKLKKAKPKWSDQDLDAEAAKIVRNTMPDYSQVPNVVKALRRVPLIGTFTSFTSEVIRNSVNIIDRSIVEMKDKDLKGVGVKRMSSFMLFNALPIMAAKVLMDLFDVDDEEDEATRAIAAPWDKYSQLMYIGRSPSGDPQYINVSNTDPFSLFKTPFFVSQKDGLSVSSVVKGALMSLEPFYAKEIGTTALMELAANKNDYGGEIYNPNADLHTQTRDGLIHVLKAVEPGILRTEERIRASLTGKKTSTGLQLDPMVEIGAVLTGQRVTTADRKKAIRFRSFDFQNAGRDATSRFNKAWRRNDATEGEIQEAYAQFKEDRQKAFKDYQDSLKAVSRLGLTEEEILLETNEGRNDTKSAKIVLSLLRAGNGETPIPEKVFTKSQRKEIDEKGKTDILKKIAPEMFEKE